jgi:hypothetical protein
LAALLQKTSTYRVPGQMETSAPYAENNYDSEDLKIQENCHIQEMLIKRINLGSIMNRILNDYQVGNTDTI